MTPNPVIPSAGGAYGNILNRALAEANAETYFRPYVDVLDDIVDYGTHLIPRCWLSSSRSLRDIVVLVVLTKQVLEAADASVVMLRKSCVKPCLLTVRAAFEASVYAEFVLRGRQDRAARAYYVAYLRRRRRWANRAIRGTAERRSFLRDLRGMPFRDPFASARGQGVARAEASHINAKLNERRFRHWNTRFDQIERRRQASWYEPLFRRRVFLRDVAQTIGRKHEYRSIYEIGSEEAHGGRLGGHLEVPEDGQMLIIPIREPSEFQFVVKTLSGIVIHTYRRILDHYRPSEVENFVRKYSSDWRPLLRQPLTVTTDRTIVPLG